MQGGSTGIICGGLKYQVRCIAGVTTDPDYTSFLAGTLSLKEDNEVHMIRMSPSGTELICEGCFLDRAISPSPWLRPSLSGGVPPNGGDRVAAGASGEGVGSALGDDFI